MSAAEEEVIEQIEEDLDIRGELEAAMRDEPEEVEEAEETEAETAARERDEKGRFKAKEIEAEPEQPATEAVEAPEKEAVVEAEQALAPPNGWDAEAKAKWHELSPEIQRAVDKREQDVAKFVSKSDDERQFGRDMYKAVSPYMAQIQSEGGTPTAAVQSLLNTAYVLRTGSPEQKRQLLMQTAQQFGVDLTETEQSQMDPSIAPLYQKISQLEGMLHQQSHAGEEQLKSEVQNEVTAFATDPANVHYSEVKGHMAALLREGAAADMKEAYDQACWARPDIRATLQAQLRADEEQKRRAEAKAKAEAAKRKGSGITGGPGAANANPASETRTIRDELEANWNAQSSAV